MAKSDNIEAHGITNIGLRRKTNEDSYLIVDAPHKGCDVGRLGKLFVVADGMGGHAAGEIASKMACDGMLKHYYQIPEFAHGTVSHDRLLAGLERSIRKTNTEIESLGRTVRSYHGMGTTLSVLVLWENTALIGHVGDSRVYRMRAGCLEQLTVDHTEVQAMVDRGHITREQAATHPFRNILLRAVGASEQLEEVYTKIEEVKPGDTYLLSSDGLHDLVPDGDIRKTLGGHSNPESACGDLVRQALDNGGSDNITAVIVRVL